MITLVNGDSACGVDRPSIAGDVSGDALVAVDVDRVEEVAGLVNMVGEADRAILVGGGVAVGVGERSLDFVPIEVILRK